MQNKAAFKHLLNPEMKAEAQRKLLGLKLRIY